MRKPLYLNGIRAFEAAARARSFAAAAVELAVTPAAISRMVRLLEARLGTALFVRRANKLVLTPAGETYQAGVAPLLHALAALTEQIQSPSRGRVLTVGVGPTFAIRWLIPRLAEFRKLAPDMDVRITTGGIAAPHADDWTCGIRLGHGDWPGLVAEPLFAAHVLPVCAPQWAARLKLPRQLTAATLLRVAHAPGDWPLWLAAAECSSLTASGPVFDYYGQALQAAADGVGVAMGITPYIDDDLAAGRLVAPFPLAVAKGDSWYFVYKESRRTEPAFAAFQHWLQGSVGIASPRADLAERPPSSHGQS